MTSCNPRRLLSIGLMTLLSGWAHAQQPPDVVQSDSSQLLTKMQQKVAELDDLKQELRAGLERIGSRERQLAQR